MTDSSADSGTENGTDYYPAAMQSAGWWARIALFGVLEPRSEGPPQAPRPRVVEWNERDEWVALCVKMGLNAQEIVNLSFSWPQPITTKQQCYDKIKQLHLDRLYRRKDKKRAGTHNQNIIYVFSKLTGQALEYGLEVREVMRDSVPEGMRFRPDLSLRISRFQFHVEVQLSKIEGTRWSEKFRNYEKLYKITKKPFRVLFLIDKGVDVTTLRARARKTEHPQLFLFLTIHEFRLQRDVLKAPVWMTATGQKVRLVVK